MTYVNTLRSKTCRTYLYRLTANTLVVPEVLRLPPPPRPRPQGGVEPLQTGNGFSLRFAVNEKCVNLIIPYIFHLAVFIYNDDLNNRQLT